jgi:thioredoxin-like negative regulator of GroEL
MNTFPPPSDQSDQSSDFDDDEIVSKERERRFAELKQRQKDATVDTRHYGQLEELTNEQDLLHASLHCRRLVVLFHMPAFKRCQQVSEALSAMAKEHVATRFVQVEATRAPFLTSKWAIKQLPCVVRIEGKEATDKVVGFEGVMREGTEELDYKLLEERLVR